MPDLNLIFKGDGKFITGSKADLALAGKAFAVDERVRGKITKRRSTRQNSYFHAIAQRAFDNQQAGPEFDGWEELRDYLLVKAGWIEVERLDFPDIGGNKRDQVHTMAPFVARFAEEKRRRHRTVVVSIDTKALQIVIKYPKSFAFEKCDSEEAGEIVDSAINTICTELIPGTDPEELRYMAKGGR